jgi:hypothetical protein
VGEEYNRIKRNKLHKYKNNQFVEGYVPGGEITKVEQTTGDIIISNPIITEQVIKPKGTNYIQRLIPVDTTADGDLASLNVVDKAPVTSTNVLIALNGRVIVPADGPSDLSVAGAWFESPDGTVIRAHGAVQLGDKLKWNGSCSGVEVFSTDELILLYEVDAL